MKTKEIIKKNIQREKTQFPTVYENESDYQNDYSQIFNSSSSRLMQSRVSKISKIVNMTNRIRSQNANTPNNGDKFATLKYGENKELLFNLDCQVQSLIIFFNQKCKSELEVLSDDSESCFDLIDSTGQIKNIQDESKKTAKASTLFESRKTYTLAQIKKNELNESITIPLVKKVEVSVIKDNLNLTKPIKKYPINNQKNLK